MLWNVFLKSKLRRHPGSNQGLLGLQPNALPLSYFTLNIVNRQSTLFTRIHITSKKAFVLGVPIFFSFPCSKHQPTRSKFFSTQSIVLTQRSRSPKMDTVPFRFTLGYFHVRHGSLCSPKNLFGGSHFLLSVTMVILDSSPVDAQMDTSEHFL